MHRFAISAGARRPRRGPGLAAVLAMAWAIAGLSGCTDAPPSWDRLLSSKINDQFPGYRVTPGEAGTLQVERPGQSPQTVAVAPIALLCQRGPRECDYAVDQMLLALGGQKP